MDGIVEEVIDSLPVDESVVRMSRKEELLFQVPPNSPAMTFWRDYEPLAAVHFSQTYTPSTFAPPRDVYCGNFLRLEWQQIQGRQPFYHRNADVDEVSLQIAGKRTLMTELGSLDVKPGDWSRIPVGIAHDNSCWEDIHLLFYFHAAAETGKIVATAAKREVQFEGWSPATVPELLTACLGTRGCDLAVSLVDEELLLKTCSTMQDLSLQRATDPGNDTEWLYKSQHVWIGVRQLNNAAGKVYTRHRRADAIHYQLSGTRTLVTQRGTIELVPGDFISIPMGCAYTSICVGESSHILVVTSQEAPLKANATKMAMPTTIQNVLLARKQISGNI
ncbi:hypothetical protein BKA64DRAFT_109409 [Cadophora sp. MPI-SDFR-AT-0126]|nr:hypothetical protein BKA64DRAFT_109409 [Leotiomycetes sp. MPI-SDFR-AT-0126]